MRSNQLWEISFKPLGPEALKNSTFASALQLATDAMTGVKELSLAKATAKRAVLLAKEEAVASSIDSSTTGARICSAALLFLFSWQRLKVHVGCGPSTYKNQNIPK